MKIQIRTACFETNSSSSHTLAIDFSDPKWEIESVLRHMEIRHMERGYLSLTGGQFGWGVELFNDSWSKLNYVAVAMESEFTNLLDYYVNVPEIKEAGINKFCIEYFRKRNLLLSVVRSALGVKELFISFDFTTKHSLLAKYSYIDHQSRDEYNIALEDFNTLKNFIFNEKSTLIISNDNL